MTVHLLFNLSLLLVLLFFTHIWYERSQKNYKPRHVLLLYVFVSIILCLLFSYYLNPQIRIDLRMIPLVIGGLYYGSVFLLAGFLILARATVGIDSGFLVTIIMIVALAGLLHVARPFFLKQTVQRRLLLGVVFSIVSSLLFLGTISYIDHPIYALDAWLSFFLVSAVGTGIVAYAIESVNYNMNLRKEMVKAKRMEAICQMGAAMSHELRNPLTSVRGFLQLINEDKNVNQQYSEYIKIVLNELDQAEEVIANYLTFAKPSIVSIEKVDIQAVLNQVITELSPILDDNQITIEEEFYSIETFHGDKKMLRDCFANLLKNSIDSMPEGGKISLNTAETKDALKISISDTGIGMTEAQINRVGEPYYRIDEGNGTGLSMMVVQSIVRALNGKMDIKSKLNEGTTFIITLPK